MKKFLDRVLVCIALFLLAFIVTMIVIFCVKGEIPDTLVDKVLDGATWELAISGLITVSKNLTKSKKKGGSDESID